MGHNVSWWRGAGGAVGVGCAGREYARVLDGSFLHGCGCGASKASDFMKHPVG